MRLKLIIGIVLLSTVALPRVYAQQPNEYNLKVSPQEIELIGKGIGLLPFNDVAALVQKLRSQVMEQQSPSKPTQTVPDPEKK